MSSLRTAMSCRREEKSPEISPGKRPMAPSRPCVRRYATSTKDPCVDQECRLRPLNLAPVVARTIPFLSDR
jgi:hypothetical protein